jgi:hypothetical protein
MVEDFSTLPPVVSLLATAHAANFGEGSIDLGAAAATWAAPVMVAKSS